MTTRYAKGFAIAILVVTTIGCDRVTKHYATRLLAGAPDQTFLGDTIRLQYAENTGAFLSLGATLPRPIRTAVFSGGTALLLAALLVAAVQFGWRGARLIGVLLFVAGGASNLADRIAYGSVVDFMNIGIGPLRTGIFNVADMAIMLGAAVMLWPERHTIRDST